MIRNVTNRKEERRNEGNPRNKRVVMRRMNSRETIGNVMIRKGERRNVENLKNKREVIRSEMIRNVMNRREERRKGENQRNKQVVIKNVRKGIKKVERRNVNLDPNRLRKKAQRGARDPKSIKRKN